MSGYSSESHLEAAGYQFVREEIRHDPLIVLPDSDGIETLTELLESLPDDCRMKLVACHWAEAEDDSRFAPLVDAMLAEIAASLPATESNREDAT